MCTALLRPQPSRSARPARRGTSDKQKTPGKRCKAAKSWVPAALRCGIEGALCAPSCNVPLPRSPAEGAHMGCSAARAPPPFPPPSQRPECAGGLPAPLPPPPSRGAAPRRRVTTRVPRQLPPPLPAHLCRRSAGRCALRGRNRSRRCAAGFGKSAPFLGPISIMLALAPGWRRAVPCRAVPCRAMGTRGAQRRRGQHGASAGNTEPARDALSRSRSSDSAACDEWPPLRHTHSQQSTIQVSPAGNGGSRSQGRRPPAGTSRARARA